MSSPVLVARSQLGVATRKRDPQQILDARRSLAAEKLEDYVNKVVSEAPPLTAEQRARIAALLGVRDAA